MTTEQPEDGPMPAKSETDDDGRHKGDPEAEEVQDDGDDPEADLDEDPHA
jgi:hypothetical protein